MDRVNLCLLSAAAPTSINGQSLQQVHTKLTINVYFGFCDIVNGLANAYEYKERFTKLISDCSFNIFGRDINTGKIQKQASK